MDINIEIINNAIDEYGKLNTYFEFVELQTKFLKGIHAASLTHYGSLYIESSQIKDHLVNLLNHWFISTDSQNGHFNSNDKNQHSCKYGYGYISGYLRNAVTKNLPSNIIMCINDRELVLPDIKHCIVVANPNTMFCINVLGTDDTNDVDISNHIWIEPEDDWKENIEYEFRVLSLSVKKFILESFTQVIFVDNRVGDYQIIPRISEMMTKVVREYENKYD